MDTRLERYDRRVIVGWIAAPVAAWLTLWTLLVVLNAAGLYGEKESLGYWLSTLLASAKIVVPVAAIAEGLFAKPLHDWLQRTKRRRLHNYALAGMAIGACPFIAYVFLGIAAGLRTRQLASIRGDLSSGLVWALIGVPCGCVAAIVFWGISVRRVREEGRG